jgi:hypothetical protein
MDSSNSGGKKIVFKKRMLASQPAPEEVDAQTDASVVDDEDVQTNDRSVYYYQGEIFDQFNRPLAVAGGESRLTELASEILAPPAPAPRLKAEERDARSKEFQEISETLADQIYDLAQKVRETDLDVYLSAFNVVLADRTCPDSKEILDRANEYFTERYYAAIRERGERPEIFHQIVKRVGHESADRIAKIVRGLDVPATAKALWDLYHGAHADKVARMTDILLDCTERQVRALREEFLLIPYKDVARQLHEILQSPVAEPQGETRRTIGKSELYEQKKQAAFKSREKSRALRYLLLGRSRAEMALIKKFYLELGEPDAAESEVSLEAHIKRNLLQSDVDRIGELISGWSARAEAEEIHNLLYPPSIAGELDDWLSDPRDAADRDHTQGIGPFLRRFKKRRMLNGRAEVTHRIMNVYEMLAERIAALSPERFLKTNEALIEHFGYDLDPTLFPSLAVFDARRMAMLVSERINHSFDLFEMFKPMEFLAPRQCLATQRAYECLYGVALRQAMEDRLSSVRARIPAKEFEELFERYIHGQGRWPLNIDLLARYRGEEPEPGVWDYDFRASPEDEERAISLAELIDQDTDKGELDHALREALWRESYDELNRIERAFYDLTDPHLPLRAALSECLSEEAMTAVEALLAGLDVNDVVHRVHDDPVLLKTYGDLPPSFIKLIRASFERTFFVPLSEYVVGYFEDPAFEDSLIDALAVVMMPEAYQFRTLLHGLRKDSPVESEYLKELWMGPIGRVLAFERAYDLAFPRLRVHLKYAAARLAISVHVFADIILSLEGIDPDITTRIQECFDSVDITGLQGILSRHRRQQVILEECFDLINPEAQLRRSIKAMKVDLDLINETLLHLECFFARDVAAEIHELSQTLNGEELGRACSELLAAPSSSRPNHRIPVDINWMDEMVYQIAIAYQRERGVEFIAALRAQGVPSETLEELTSKVFGHEVCVSARELFNLLKNAKEGRINPDYAEERLCAHLETRGTRHRDRLLRAYNAHWAQNAGYGSLIDDVTKFFKSSNAKKKMVSLLIGVTPDRNQGPSKPVPIQ